MTGNEVVAILALMSAAWPYVEITENTGRVWTAELERLHADDALATTHMMIRTSERFPSIAEFLGACRPLTAKRLQAKQAADYERKALEAGATSDPEDGRAGVSRHINAILAAQRVKNHWHGGPNPCEACGGMTSDPKIRAKYAREIETG